MGNLVIAKVLAENLKKKRPRGTRKTAENSWLIPDPPRRSLLDPKLQVFKNRGPPIFY